MQITVPWPQHIAINGFEYCQLEHFSYSSDCESVCYRSTHQPLCRFTSDHEIHVGAVTRSPLFPETSRLELRAYYYASWAGNPMTMKSTTGLCVFPSDLLISWKCKKQVSLQYWCRVSRCLRRPRRLFTFNSLLMLAYLFNHLPLFCKSKSVIQSSTIQCLKRNQAYWDRHSLRTPMLTSKDCPASSCLTKTHSTHRFQFLVRKLIMFDLTVSLTGFWCKWCRAVI